MRDYMFQLLQHGQLVGEGFGQGNSAMEAFENGIEQRSIIIPCGEEVEVLAVNNNMLGIRFSALRKF